MREFVLAIIVLGAGIVGWQMFALVRRMLHRRGRVLAVRIVKVVEIAVLWYSVGGAITVVLPSAVHLSLLWQERVAIVLATFITAVVGTRLARELLSASIKGERASPLAASLMRSITYVAIYTIAFVIILATVGVNISAMVAAIGAGGLVIGLALQETLTNFFAGLYILLTGKFKVGDYVRFDSFEGTVEDITWRTTMFRLVSRAVLVVPNQRLTSTVLTVFSATESPVAFRLEFLLHPSADYARAEAALVHAHRALVETGRVKGLCDQALIFRYGESSSLGTQLVVWVTVESIDQLFNARAVVMRTFLEALRNANIPLVLLRQ